MERYNEYKDSGVQWLGEIPRHWEIVALKRISQICSGSTPSSSVERYWNGNIKWITPADFKTETKFVNGGCRTITEEGASSCSTELIPKGSIVFSKRAPVGQVSIITSDLCVNQGCLACIPFSLINGTYLYYLLSSYKNEFESISGGTTFKEISLKDFSSFKVALPSLIEQQAIATYLDTATAKIDEAIAQQQKMIDLLNERKQIIINNAVTKGLNPDVPMKDSGVDWIGEIPEHWEVSKYKFHGTIKSGDGIKNEDIKEFGDYQVWGGNGLIGYHFTHNVQNSAIVIGRVGALCGNVRYVDNPTFVTDNALIFSIRSNINHSFLLYSMTAADFNKLNVSSAQPLITGTKVKNVSFALPPINEQKVIVESIQTSLYNVNNAIKAAEKQISLLQERKQIIINDVVTGKVKVI
ncbi:MAG: restriction endonuclease subunit S [Bacteroidales bacterium]|nr:restriction endonuclease subunit S [Bacteroidales bacterium]